MSSVSANESTLNTPASNEAWKKWFEVSIHGLLMVCATVSVITTVSIVVVLMTQSLSFFAFDEVSSWDFLHRHALVADHQTEPAFWHHAAGVRYGARGGRLGGHRHPAWPGHRDLSQRVRLGHCAQRRQTAAGNPRRYSVGRVWLRGSRVCFAANQVMVSFGRVVQRGECVRRCRSDDPADDRLAQRRGAQIGATLATRGGLCAGSHQARCDGRRGRAGGDVGHLSLRSCWQLHGPSAKRWPSRWPQARRRS